MRKLAELMVGLALIILAMAGVSFALWLAQTAKELDYARREVKDTWEELRKELMARREMIPYIVGTVRVDASQLLDVIGNACDLADHVSTVQECSQAETRLTSALNKLFSALDADSSSEVRETVGGLRSRLSEQNSRIAVRKEIYNRQAETLNTLLERGVARLFVSLGLYRKVDLY